LITAIADLHDEMAMTWSFPALLELLYGYRHLFYHEHSGDLIITPVKVEGYTKPSGAQVPSGFFFGPDSEHISAISFHLRPPFQNLIVSESKPDLEVIRVLTESWSKT
jgi:hypothetical protein